MMSDFKELFMLSDDDLTLIKSKAAEIINILPAERKTAVITLAFTLNILEEETGIKVEGIRVKYDEK